MRFTQILPLLPVASAWVITEAEVFEKIENTGKASQQFLESAFESTQNVLDDAIGKAVASAQRVGDGLYHKVHKAGYDAESWMEGSPYFDETQYEITDDHHHHHPPHHGGPHHPPHHHKSNLTIYQLISNSKYTTKLAKLIDEDEELVKILNGTKANYTVFAPTDVAFEKIPDHGKKPSKEFIKEVLLYHISPHLYPAARVLHSYTIPTLYTPKRLGNPQRLTVRVTLKGPAINFYSRLVAVDIFGTNGVIHGVDSIILPPPPVTKIIGLLPGEFSTLELGLSKTGLLEKFDDEDLPYEGGTLFAPSNFAFKKLGPKANAFLFSKYGQKYLKALLEYHLVVNQTLYTDAFYDTTSKENSNDHHERPGNLHYDLPTILGGRTLGVDIARYGPFLVIRVNGFSRVTVHDGVAEDGVIQVISNVLIPPKTVDGKSVFWEGEELSVEELKERLEPLVDENIEL